MPWAFLPFFRFHRALRSSPLKLHPSSFILLRFFPRRPRRPGRPPFFQSPGIANNFHNSRLESFPPRAEVEEHRPLFRSPSRFLPAVPPVPSAALFLFFLAAPSCPFLLARALSLKESPPAKVSKKGDENQNRLRSGVPSRRLSLPLEFVILDQTRLNLAFTSANRITS